MSSALTCQVPFKTNTDAKSALLCLALQVKTKCINKACQAELMADQSRMIVETSYGQAPPPPPKAV